MSALRKNISGQVLTFTLVNATTGAPLTSASVTTKVALDGTQSAGAGTVTELGTGQYKYVPTQGETNGASVGFSFTATNAVPVNLHCFTVGFDPTAAVVPANVTQIDGNATNGYNATLKLKMLDISNSTGPAIHALSSSAGDPGVLFEGSGADSAGLHAKGTTTAPGAKFQGGNAGDGIAAIGGGVGCGISVDGGSNGPGLLAKGHGTGVGIGALGGDTGAGAAGFTAQALTGDNNGMYLVGSGAGDGIHATGGASDGRGALYEGQGAGPGVIAIGGDTGPGASILGGASGGNGLNIWASAGNADGLNIAGVGNGNGAKIEGDGTGDGLDIRGGPSGRGLYALGGASADRSGAYFEGGGNGHGIEAVGVGTGQDFKGDPLDTLSTLVDVAVSTRAVAGDAMALTSGERTTLAAVIWNALTSGMSTVGSIGKRIVDFLTGDVYARIGAPAGASVSADVAAVKSDTASIISTLSGLAAAAATAVWAAGTRLLTAGTNIVLAKGTGVTGFNDPTATAIADQVWEETIADHSGTSGSTAETLNAAGSAGDPWATSLPGAYGAGSAGKIVGDNLDATVSSRATQTSVDDLPTNAELATALSTADDATLAAIAGLSIPTANQNADALLDRANAVESGLTLRHALRIVAAALGGKLSGAAGTTVTFRNVGDTKDVIVATVDSNGNRTAITLDLS